MKRNKKLIYLAVTGIVLIVFSMIIATYAYFTITVNGKNRETSNNEFNNKISIKFKDTSNLTMVNSNNGDFIIKEFTVENKTDEVMYYDLLFSELVNDYKNYGNLTYSIETLENAVNKKDVLIPNTTSLQVASLIKISKKETHSYKLTIKYTNENESVKEEGTFSTKVVIKPSFKDNKKQIYKDNTLGYHILNNNDISTTDNGLFKTNNTIDGVTVYYFKGDNTLNNNVIFAGNCFKIIRTTEDLGIRIIYVSPEVDNKCNTNTDTSLKEVFNTNDNYNAYVGYMYGSPNSKTYSSEHDNINNSKIKTYLDTWYKNNIDKYNIQVDTSPYCNNRKPKSFTKDKILYTDKGYSNNNTGYQSYYDLFISHSEASLDCNKKDLYKVSKNSEKENTYPVGLITAEEVYLAGINTRENNKNNYLDSSIAFWTMSPAYIDTSAYNIIVNKGKLSVSKVSNENIVRPVITLKKDVLVKTGDGSMDNPYIIK